MLVIIMSKPSFKELEKLVREALELKKVVDDLSQRVADLDVFMREAVMVMIEIINELHGAIDALEERADLIESIITGEESEEALRRMESSPPPAVQPSPPAPPSQPSGQPQASVSQPSPQAAPPALPARMQLLFELRQALEARRRKKKR